MIKKNNKNSIEFLKLHENNTSMKNLHIKTIVLLIIMPSTRITSYHTTLPDTKQNKNQEEEEGTNILYA